MPQVLQIAIRPFNQLYPNLANGNSVTVLLLNCHLAVQTQTQMQTEPEVFRKHNHHVLQKCYSVPLVLHNVV